MVNNASLAMEAYGGNKGTVPFIVNLGTREW